MDPPPRRFPNLRRPSWFPHLQPSGSPRFQNCPWFPKICNARFVRKSNYGCPDFDNQVFRIVIPRKSKFSIPIPISNLRIIIFKCPNVRCYKTRIIGYRISECPTSSFEVSCFAGSGVRNRSFIFRVPNVYSPRISLSDVSSCRMSNFTDFDA